MVLIVARVSISANGNILPCQSMPVRLTVVCMLARNLMFVGLLTPALVGTGCRSTKTCVETPFPGLAAELKQANTSGAWLRLLIIHGMSNHAPGYSSNFVDAIGRKLNLTQTRTNLAVLTNSTGEVNGYLSTVELTRGATNKLRAYELTWSPATYSEKTNRFEFNSRLNHKRASLNKSLKTDLLNDGFADAVLYLNSQLVELLLRGYKGKPKTCLKEAGHL